jgi:hypothetical protein
LEKLEVDLPWGLHDAHLEQLRIDWAHRSLSLVLRLAMSKHQDMDQRALITISDLAYCIIEAPSSVPPEETMPAQGLWIDSHHLSAEEEAAARLPPTPDGCVATQIFVHERNSSIYLCGRTAELKWLEEKPQHRRSSTRALFPGEEIPDPEL